MILGHEAAGIVAKVGSNVKHLQVGTDSNVQHLQVSTGSNVKHLQVGKGCCVIIIPMAPY